MGAAHLDSLVLEAQTAANPLLTFLDSLLEAQTAADSLLTLIVLFWRRRPLSWLMARSASSVRR